jgi:hypothetical protein
MFVAGPYKATYDGQSIGVTERGFELEVNTMEQSIIGDDMGESVQDDVYTGMNCFLNFVLQEYSHTGIQRSLFWPFHATFGKLGLVGRMKWDLSKPLVLTALVGTRVARGDIALVSSGPTTITFQRAVLAGGYPIRMMFSARHRNIPLRFKSYPTPTDLLPSTTSPMGYDSVSEAAVFTIV